MCGLNNNDIKDKSYLKDEAPVMFYLSESVQNFSP